MLFIISKEVHLFKFHRELYPPKHIQVYGLSPCEIQMAATFVLLIFFHVANHLSRVALQFVHEMQCKAQKNFDASRDRSLPVFGVGVAFVDESTACAPSSDKSMDGAIEDVKSVILELAPPMKELHIFPIERLYSGDSSDQMKKLEEVLNAVIDSTGKEDLLVHLRILALQKVRLLWSCN